MIRNPSLFHYACIAKGTTILAEFNPKDAELGVIAAKCLEKTPHFHATFNHTVRSKTYTFYIDEPFVYFLISDEQLEKPEVYSFLKSVRDAFVEDFEGEKKLANVTSHCFQGEFSPVFRQLLVPASYIDGIESPMGQRIGESGVIRGRVKPSRELATNMMKNRFVDENSGNGIGFSPGYSSTVQKNRGFYPMELNEHQNAKKVWKKQVWIVLSFDLIACSILFVVWLWICSGLKCMDS